MAITEKYANFNLATGLNDGTSETNAWQTPADIVEAAGERVNIKDGARYDITTSWASSVAGSSTQPVIIRGYTSTIGDGGKVKLSSSIASAINFTGKFNYIENLDVELSTTQWLNGLIVKSDQGRLLNCKIVNTTTGAMNRYVLDAGITSVINCYIEGRASNTAATAVAQVNILINSAIKATNGQPGVLVLGSYSFVNHSHALIYSGSSTTLEGVRVDGLTNTNGLVIDSFTIDGFDDGLVFTNLAASRVAPVSVSNGIISGAVHAISTDEATIVTGVSMSDIAFYNNTNNYSDMGDNEVSNPILCTADPYIDSANGDFRPNDTASGGALLRGAAEFGAGEVTNNQDVGALQHADPAGGSASGARNPFYGPIG